MKFEQFLTKHFKNDSVIKEYVNYINIHKLAQDTNKEDIVYEIHHILPESIFPEYKYEPENLVKLKLYDHLVVHYILAKTKDSKMLFAFNMMSRIRHSTILSEEQLVEAANMYSELRNDISENIKVLRLANPNTITVEGRKKLSKANTGTIAVIDKITNKSFKVKTEEYYANTDKYSHYMSGKTHSTETKSKISENGIKGLSAFTHKENGNVVYREVSFNDIDYIKGDIGLSEVAKERFTGSVHWTNTLTGESLRAKECPGKDWIKKRSNFTNPFEGNALLLDIRTGEKVLIDKDKITPQYCIYNKLLLVSDKLIISTKECICEIIGVESTQPNVGNAFNYLKGKKTSNKFLKEALLTELDKFKIIKASELIYNNQEIK